MLLNKDLVHTEIVHLSNYTSEYGLKVDTVSSEVPNTNIAESKEYPPSLDISDGQNNMVVQSKEGEELTELDKIKQEIKELYKSSRFLDAQV